MESPTGALHSRAGGGHRREVGSSRHFGPLRRRLASRALLAASALLALTVLLASHAWAFTGARRSADQLCGPSGVAGAFCRRGLLARHATDPAALPDKWKAGPADVYSGQAQKAMYLMQENPVLFESTLEEELEALQQQKDEEERQKGALEENPKEDTLALRRRMDEVRQNDRLRIVTELMYLKVCGKFKQLGVPLIPSLKAGGDFRFGSIDISGLTDDIYSKDALDLVREHLYRIIGQQGSTAFMGSMAIVQIALFQAGQVYAMSSLFGYYLRRVDARFQLEKLAGTFGAWGDEAPSEVASPFAEEDQSSQQSLKDYVSTFGPEELQRMTTVASAEAHMAMESQVFALFGDLRVLKEKLVNALGPVSSNEEVSQKLEQAVQNGEVESLRITSEDLRRLVLEAVAFGALLNDAETQVDSLYELSPSMSRPMGALTGDDDEGRMLPE